jgi:hypothetical protein
MDKITSKINTEEKRILMEYMSGIISNSEERSPNQKLATKAQLSIMDDKPEEAIKIIDKIQPNGNRRIPQKKNFSMQLLINIIKMGKRPKRKFEGKLYHLYLGKKSPEQLRKEGYYVRTVIHNIFIREKKRK